MKLYRFLIMLIYLLAGCNFQESATDFTGFWEGPHPENKDKKFYIRLFLHDDSIQAKGYWTLHRFYSSEFEVKSVTVSNDSIRFYVPAWNCFYTGRFSENLIRGGFHCDGEPFDTVVLKKNDVIGTRLVEAKYGCSSAGYKYKYFAPPMLNDGIQSSFLKSKNDSAFINKIIPEIMKGEYGRINSFLMLKNNKLVCEEYFYGYTRNDLHQIESSTKSITSLLTGIAFDKGFIANINEPLYTLFPEYPHLRTIKYRQITISNLLTMTSGFAVDDHQLFQSANRIDYALKRKLTNEAGRVFAYDGGNTEILGAILKKKTGLFADVFAMENLFKPLGIHQYDWALQNQQGFPCMSGTLRMLPRDLLKIGLLVLNHGTYQHKQVTSKHWIEESTSAKITTQIEDDKYAYHWWNITIKSQQKSYNTIWANGLGSQFIYIFPALNVVIVTTGHNYENDSWAITSGIAKYLYLLDN